MNKELIINEMYETLSLENAQNIHREVFNDISLALLDFHISNDTLINHKRIVYASMGHGKSTSLKAYLKWITKQPIKIPVLVAVREKHLAHEIYEDVKQYAKGSIVNIDSDNKDMYENDLINYQIVIIQHSRLKNLALSFGNPYNYQYYIKNKEKVMRLLIIDEKPDFTDSAIFDIGSKNNVLDWFEDLAEPLKLLPLTLQKYKSYIVFLLSEQLAENKTDKTTKLINDEDNKTNRAIDLIKKLNEMRIDENNKNKYPSLNKLKHFKNLLTIDEYGRIDDYELRGHIGRKIIVSKYVDYSTLGMNLLVFDGTAKSNSFQYKGKFDKGVIIDNRSNYKRLSIQIDSINTTKYSREKTGNTTQKAIAKRIKQLQQTDKNLFVLPMKGDINIYKQEEAIRKSDYKYYEENGHEKGINLLNTIGKNVLKDKISLYITSLPKKNADHYKEIAIAMYDTEVNLLTNNESDNGKWFQDDRLERIYRGELYSELLQIIHRTDLRNLNSNKEIIVYMAYDEDTVKYNVDGFEIIPISENLKRNYLKDECKILDHHEIIDISMYGRDKKLEKFADMIKDKIDNKEVILPSPVGKFSKTFRTYLNKHWENYSNEINGLLGEYGFKVVEVKDRYSNKSKYISKFN